MWCRVCEGDSAFWKSVIQRALHVCIKLLTDCITSTYPPLSSRLQLDPQQQGIRVTLPCVFRRVSISQESKVLQQPSRECRTDIQILLGWRLAVGQAAVCSREGREPWSFCAKL